MAMRKAEVASAPGGGTPLVQELVFEFAFVHEVERRAGPCTQLSFLLEWQPLVNAMPVEHKGLRQSDSEHS